VSRAPSTRGPDERVLTLADVELVAVGIAHRDPFDVPERASARSSGAESDEPCCLGVRVGDMQIEMHAVLPLLRLGNALHEEHGTRVALQRNEAAGLHGDGVVVVVEVGYAIPRGRTALCVRLWRGSLVRAGMKHGTRPTHGPAADRETWR